MINNVESLDAPVAVIGHLRHGGVRDIATLQQLTADEALDALHGSRARLDALTTAMAEAGLSFAEESTGALERARARRQKAVEADRANLTTVPPAKPESFELGDPLMPVEYLDLDYDELDYIQDAGIRTVGQLLDALPSLPRLSRNRLEPILAKCGFRCN